MLASNLQLITTSRKIFLDSVFDNCAEVKNIRESTRDLIMLKKKRVVKTFEDVQINFFLILIEKKCETDVQTAF